MKKKQKYWAARDDNDSVWVYEVKPVIDTWSPWSGRRWMPPQGGVAHTPEPERVTTIHSAFTRTPWKTSRMRVVQDAHGDWIPKPKKVKKPKDIVTYTYHIPSGCTVTHKGIHSRAVIGNEGFSAQRVTLTVEYVR